MGLMNFLENSVNIIEGYIKFSEDELVKEELKKLLNKMKDTIKNITDLSKIFITR